MPSEDEILYNEARDLARSQDDHRRELVGRAFSILNLSIAIVVAGVLVISLSLGPEAMISESPLQVRTLGVIATLAWLAVLVCCHRATSPSKGWHEGIDLEVFQDTSQDYVESPMRRLSRIHSDNVRDNQKAIDTKLSQTRWAAIFLFAQALCVVFLAYSVLISSS